MIKILEYSKDKLPKQYKCQILSFLRINYPEGFMGENQLRNWISDKEMHPYHILIVDEDILIAHTEVLWKNIKHEEIIYKAYGLSGVFTYPNFRGQGYGLQIVNLGTKYITKQDGDIGIFHCKPSLEQFYKRAGWIAMNMAPATLIGNTGNHTKSDELMFMKFLSKKGKMGRKSFEEKPLYFGEDTW